VCALITNIQSYSIHDGPGIRTVVFLKGCSLRCVWCSNPECISPQPEIGLFLNLCSGCGTCAKVCPQAATTMSEEGYPVILRERCTACEACVEACPREARTRWGNDMSVEEVLAWVARDKMFYESSGGGVTVSGGEPLLQAAFVRELFEKCHALGIHTCVETSGHVPWSSLAEVLSHTDLFLYDLKVMNPVRHQELAGSTNTQILNNARKLVEYGVNVFFRMPLVPGMNDTEENIRETAAFLTGIGAARLELMPYHKYGLGKYRALGREYLLGEVESPTPEQISSVREKFKLLGVECTASL